LYRPLQSDSSSLAGGVNDPEDEEDEDDEGEQRKASVGLFGMREGLRV